jgi:adducin
MSQNCANGLTDGGKYIDSLDPDDPEYVRQMRRPVEVKEDVRRMEERQRVKRILQSKAFRDELEDLVVELQLGTSLSGPAPISTRLPLNAIQTQPTLVGRGLGACIPIADIREADTTDYDKGEKLFRCKLASLYRLVDLFGWSHGLDSYITGRISQDYEHFLISPYGMLHNEVTASSLVKVDMRGDVLNFGNSRYGLGVNKVGFSLHAAIYASRPDIKCVVHLRCTTAVAITALKCGLLPVCKEAMSVGEVSYYDYSGVVMDPERRDKLRRALGPSNRILVLRNFGILVGGESVEEAFWLARNVMTGVDKQLSLSAKELQEFQQPSDEEKRSVVETMRQTSSSGDDKKWRLGEQDFEMLMRQLDNVGYRTGYLYRELQVDDNKQTDNEIVVPPTASSFIYSFDDDGKNESSAKSRLTPLPKTGQKSDWLGQAKKEEINDSVLNATKSSKWAPEETSTPIKATVQYSSQKSGDNNTRQEVFQTSLDADRLQGGAGEPIATKYIEKMEAAQNNASKIEPSSPQKSVSSNDDHEVSSGNTLERESSKKDKKKKGFHMPFGSKKK